MITIDTGVERWARDTAAAEAAAHPDSPKVSLAYEPFAKQSEFHASPAKYRLFGGAAGPGKSKALLMEAIVQAHEHPGVNTLLLRRTFPELEQSLLLYFRRDVPRELYDSYNESKHTVTWRNGSTTRFGYCQRENDVYQYQGAEFLFIGIDELTLFTLRQWQFLTSRNRCPVAGAFPCMAGATNPGNIGHAWVKSLWIDKQPAPGMEQSEEYDPADYDFISARVTDNPIYASDENYLKTLRALPSHLRRAFLDGDWDVFAGQYFDRFDTALHTVRAEQIEWKPWWPRWISIDWGFEHPAASYWHASGPASSFPVASPPFPVGARRAVPIAASPESTQSRDPQSATGFVAAPFTGAIFGSSDQTQEATAQDCGAVGAQHAAPGAALSGSSHNLYSGVPRVSVPNGETSPSNCAGRSSAAPLREREAASESSHDCALRRNNQSAVILSASDQDARRISAPPASPPSPTNESSQPSRPDTRVVTYREYVTHRTAPRELAHQIIERSRDSANAREKIDAIYLSPDAFARRTDEASIAEQMGDVFAAAGFPRPIPADNDRVGGWMLMYQMLDAGEWLLTDNCIELIRTLPNLVRDPIRIEDVEKMDGDDPADAARYGLKSRYAARAPGATRAPFEQRVTSADPTVRAIQARKAQLEESQRSHPVSFLHRRR
jgi:hypothetical protein